MFDASACLVATRRPSLHCVAYSFDPAPTAAFAFKTKDAAFIAVMKEGARDALMGQERSEAWRSLDVAILHKGILAGLLDIPDDAVFDYEV